MLLASVGIGICKYCSIFMRILLDYDTRYVGLSDSYGEAIEIKMICVWRDILNCSCKWLHFSAANSV